jgi:hypothetical protein
MRASARGTGIEMSIKEPTSIAANREWLHHATISRQRCRDADDIHSGLARPQRRRKRDRAGATLARSLSTALDMLCADTRRYRRSVKKMIVLCRHMNTEDAR